MSFFFARINQDWTALEFGDAVFRICSWTLLLDNILFFGMLKSILMARNGGDRCWECQKGRCSLLVLVLWDANPLMRQSYRPPGWVFMRKVTSIQNDKIIWKGILCWWLIGLMVSLSLSSPWRICGAIRLFHRVHIEICYDGNVNTSDRLIYFRNISVQFLSTNTQGLIKLS